MEIFEQIKQLLDSEGIEYKLLEHEPVRTSEDAARVRGVELKTGAKAMVVKTGSRFYLLVMPADKRLDWKKAKQALGVKEIRFATEEEAENVTGVKMGSVHPFGNIIGIRTYFDPGIQENEWINFNPGSTRHTISMKAEDLVRLVNPETISLT